MKRILLTVGVIGVVFAGALMVGNKSGQEKAAKSKARIELVWPNYDSLSPSDRALLGGYSLACDLAGRPLQAVEVVDCLRGAAARNDSILPRGFTNEQASARLEHLLSDAGR